MKKVITITIATACLTIVFIMACSTPKIKMQKAGANVVNAGFNIKNPNSDLAIAKRDSVATYRKFRSDAITKLSHNISKISNYRKGIDTSKACTDKVVCEQKADSLTNSNNNLIVTLDNSKADKNWTSYKRKFKSDLDKLSFVVGGLTKPSK
jgi:hypothetical protein